MNISDMSKGVVENFIKAFDKDAKNTIETHEYKRAGYKFCAIVCGILLAIYIILSRILPFLSSLTFIGVIFMVGIAVFIYLAREETNKIRKKQQAEKEIQEIAEKQEKMIKQTAINLGLDEEEVRKEMYREPREIWLEQKDQQFEERRKIQREEEKVMNEKRAEEYKIKREQKKAAEAKCLTCIHGFECRSEARQYSLTCASYVPRKKP